MSKASPFISSLSADQLRIHEALCESHYIAGAKAAWNVSCISEGATEAFNALLKSREGHLNGYSEAVAALAALQSAADTPAPQEHLAGTPEVEHMRQKAISNARERNAALRAIQAALDDFELIVDRINAGQINRACATAMQGAKEAKLALAASAREDGR